MKYPADDLPDRCGEKFDISYMEGDTRHTLYNMELLAATWFSFGLVCEFGWEGYTQVRNYAELDKCERVRVEA